MRIAPKLAFLLLLFQACSSGSDSAETTDNAGSQAGIEVPEGFKAEVYADDLGKGRHMASRANGDLYLRLSYPERGESIVALRDSNQDGIVDRKVYFEEIDGGTGIKVHNGYLYFSTNTQVFRRRFNGNELVPSGERELILTLADQNQHAAKPLAFDEEGNMYVTIGAPSNACQDPSRTKGVAGQDPCPLLESSGGIWKFSANTPNQTFEDGENFATGIRHAVGITWNPNHSKLYAMQHGRDQLHEFWPEIYTAKQSAELPGEEFLRIEEGSDFGWPYCYYDWQKRVKLLNPEYGGNGDSIGRCGNVDLPLMGFPGHWAPNAIEFYNQDQFPVNYKGGAFIAFHGSWNRAPFPQEGYRVVFVPFSGPDPISGYQSFATGFSGKNDQPESPASAEYRPCGLAVGSKGSLFISDSQKGRIWRISYEGN
tara:strand:- start:946 stop:2223 length:1278 start_codon:yes stop_codon:yes gene_type:complete